MDITWRSDFDLCTILVLVLFGVIYRNRNRFQSLAGKLFELMYIDLLLATIVEYIEVYFSHINPIAPPAIKCGLLCLYEILICMLSFLFSLHVVISARLGTYTQKNFIWYLFYTPALATLLAILTTQVTHFVFYYEDGVFHTGPFYFGVYFVVGAYLLFSAVITVSSRKTIMRRNRISFIIFLVLGGAGLIYQAITVGGLVANFFCALGLILVYFFQQSTYDTLDENANLYNRQALLIHVNELINSRKAFSIIGLTPDSLMDIMHSKGSFYSDAIVRLAGERLRDVFGASETYSLGSGCFAVISMNLDKAEMLSTINGCFEKAYTVGNESFLLTASGCYLRYPDDYATGDSALELVSKGLDIAVQTGNSTLVTTDNYNDVRDSLVTKMKHEQLTLEREKEEAELAKEEAEMAKEEAELAKEEAELAKANAESSDKAKTTFLAHMSHEIRTPLTTIMGMTEILLRQDIAEHTRDSIAQINSAGKSLLQIINDILDFSKIESGCMEIVKDPFDVLPLIDSAVNVLNVRCDSKPIDIVTEIDEEMPSVLFGDETRIKQVIFNLTSNAAKYTDSGTITLTVRWNSNRSSLFVSVRDTGRGIREKDMASLFDSFSRFDAHANKAIEGTGLGLAITKRIVELMGGELVVESEYGKGSCFSFEIILDVYDSTPIREAQSNGEIKRIRTASDITYFVAPKAKVLIVDDNSFNRTIAEDLIRPHKLQIDQAASGSECIEKASAEQYDMIFLDHMMPGMDGFETLRHLLAIPEFVKRETPVIAFSANAVSGMREKFSEAGFKDFLTKPIEVAALERMLVEYLPEDKLDYLSKEEFNALNSDKESGSEFDFSALTLAEIDISTGLLHTEHNIGRYIKLIHMILNDRSAVSARLLQEYDTDDVANYTIDIHALKSNLASIGANAASALAKELEDAGRIANLQFIHDNHPVFMNLYAKVCDELTAIQSAYSSWQSNSGSADSERELAELAQMLPDYSDCLGCIKMLLEECEYDTAICLTSLFAKLFTDDEKHEALTKLNDMLEMFNYDGALELLTK